MALQPPFQSIHKGTGMMNFSEFAREVMETPKEPTGDGFLIPQQWVDRFMAGVKFDEARAKRKANAMAESMTLEQALAEFDKIDATKQINDHQLAARKYWNLSIGIAPYVDWNNNLARFKRYRFSLAHELMQVGRKRRLEDRDANIV